MDMKSSKMSALKELIRALLKKEGQAGMPDDDLLAVEVETDDPDVAGDLMDEVGDAKGGAKPPVMEEEEEDWRKDFSRPKRLPPSGKTRSFVAPNATSPKAKMMARR